MNARIRFALFVVLVVGSVGGRTPQTYATTVVSSWSATVPAVVLNLGVCIDGTPSMPPEVTEAGIDAVASAMRAGVSDVETAVAAPPVGRPPIAGIHVVVRRVSANSMASVADGLIDFEVPGVPGLAPEPDPAEYETYATRIVEWDTAAARMEAIIADADAARDELLVQLTGLNPAAPGSEIVGCVTALRDSFPVRAEMLVVIVSDLQQTGAPQLRGDYRGVDVLIGHFCTGSARCAQAEADFRSVLTQAGVVSVETVAIGQLADRLGQRLEVE